MLERRKISVSLKDAPWIGISLFVLLITIFYISQYFHLGFVVNSEGYITFIDRDWWGEEVDILVGDKIVHIEGRVRVSYKDNWSANNFKNLLNEESISIEIERKGSVQAAVLPYMEGSLRRNAQVWFFPLLFWLMGTITLIFLRPRDERWLILFLFYYDAALWIVFGFVSPTNAAYSGVLFYVTVWLFLPLGVHLHFIHPEPLVKRHGLFLAPCYILAFVALVADLAGQLPMRFVVLVPLVTVVSGLVCLGWRLFRASSRPIKLASRLMLYGIVLGWGPILASMLVAVILAGDVYDKNITYLFFVFVPIWPLSYIYAIYKHDLGTIRYRANRFLGTYGFFAIYVTTYAATYFAFVGSATEVFSGGLFSLLLSLLFVVIAPYLRELFQAAADRVLFDIKYSPNEVVAAFAERIPTASSREILREIIQREILPTFLVRQSALYIFGDEGAEVIYEQNLTKTWRAPSAAELGRWLVKKGRYIPSREEDEEPRLWVRLVVPLVNQEQMLGIWLFGARDPDDFYSQDEIEILTNLANQIAPVVENFHLVELARLEVAENKRLQRELLHSQKMEAIGRFAAGIAHDFNNLLSVILGYSGMLLHQYKTGNLNESLVEIRDAGQRAADLTQQLLAFSRQSETEPKVVNVNDVIEGLIKMLRRMTGEDVELVTDLESQLASCLIDPVQMSQMVLNLTVNARDAMPEGGQLTIETTNHISDGTEDGLPEGSFVLIRFTDTGTGLDPEIRSHIFEPFFTTKDEQKGTGLGLSMVYGFIQRSRGFIFADSEMGEGTTFSVYLPAVAEAAIEVDDRPSGYIATDLSGSETILLVEDEDSVRAVTRDILEAQGYNVLLADGAVQGLEVSDSHGEKIDLLLTDVIMPQMKGPELAAILLERRHGLKVIYMSGYNEEAILGSTAGGAMPTLLQKPFSPYQLAFVVRQMLDHHEVQVPHPHES